MAKRDTRELILVTSLVLFNEFGEPNVTTNHIADEADISPGNLYYHFRRKEEIILELFKRYLGVIHPLLEAPEDNAINIENLWFRLHLLFEARGEYRFLFRNLTDLTELSSTMRHAVRGLLAEERRAIANYLELLARGGALTAGDASREVLLDNIHLAMTCWLPYSELVSDTGQDGPSPQSRAVSRVSIIMPRTPVGLRALGFQCDSW